MKTLALAAVAALTLAACTRPAVVANNNGGGVTLHGADGATVNLGSSAAPSDLPSYAPIYPGGVVTTTMDAPGQGGMVAYTSTGAAADIAGYYKSKAVTAGLGQVLDTTNTSGTTTSHIMVFSQKDTKRSLTVTVEQSSTGAKVNLLYGAS